MRIASVAGHHPDWRRRMRGELFWIVMVKMAALALLWMLFFSATHRAAVDGESVSRRLAIPQPAVPSRPGPSRQEVSHG